MFQHEIDHLDGILAVDRLDPDARKQALKQIREQTSTPRSVRPG
jgi:peptide deformylase